MLGPGPRKVKISIFSAFRLLADRRSGPWMGPGGILRAFYLARIGRDRPKSRALKTALSAFHVRRPSSIVQVAGPDRDRDRDRDLGSGSSWTGSRIRIGIQVDGIGIKLDGIGISGSQDLRIGIPQLESLIARTKTARTDCQSGPIGWKGSG